MKHITINLDNNTRINNNTKSFTPSNASAILDDIILTNISKANPYLFGKGYETGAIIDDLFTKKEPKKTLSFDIKIKKNPTIKKDTHVIFDENRDIISYTDFANAMKLLSENHSDYDSYDFELPDGTKVALQPDGLMVGETLIFFDDYDYKYYYNMLSPIAKKTIIDFTIKISK